jgi:hypothetical protein
MYFINERGKLNPGNPSSIEECFNIIDEIFKENSEIDITNMTELHFVAKTQFGLGMWMRNQWIHIENSNIKKFFENKGIYHPDDMSGIILTSYYRKCNNKEIQLEKQIEFYKKFWKENGGV